ncbi:MAG: hypothetical protein M3P06_11600 [Acidobacteriota bacterium]|nr:hypothetical protein [Acidobacteriota bacterium]
MNRACVRPDHLEVVTHKENNLRGHSFAARNARKTHCKHGHPFEGDNLHLTPTGGRRCVTCMRRRSEAAWQRVRDERGLKPHENRRRDSKYWLMADHENEKRGVA